MLSHETIDGAIAHAALHRDILPYQQLIIVQKQLDYAHHYPHEHAQDEGSRKDSVTYTHVLPGLCREDEEIDDSDRSDDATCQEN